MSLSQFNMIFVCEWKLPLIASFFVIRITSSATLEYGTKLKFLSLSALSYLKKSEFHSYANAGVNSESNCLFPDLGFPYLS